MAKQMSYIHPNGTIYPESYWRITTLYVDVPQKIAKFIFTGYKDINARQGNKESIMTKNLFLLNAEFDNYFVEIVNKTMNPQEVGYLYCVNFKDIPKEIIIENEDKTQTITTEMQSFFKDSIDC